jgi:hypothetical protein
MSQKFAKTPLWIVLMFNLATYLTFLFGPFGDWGLESRDLTTIFIISSLSMVALGYFFAHKAAIRIRFIEIKYKKINDLVLLFGGFVFLYSIYIYTGNIPWNFSAYLFNDSSENYINYYLNSFSSGDRGSRLLFIVFKIVLQPFIIIKILETLYHWKQLGLIPKFSLFFVLGSWVLLSIARGTDKEIGDIFILFFVFWGAKLTENTISFLNKKYLFGNIVRFGVSSLVLVTIVLGAAQVFTQRKFDRLQSTKVCITQISICSQLELGDDAFSENLEFGISIASSYVTQGYYGLSRALQEPFESTFGLSHSLFFFDLAKSFVGQDLLDRSYLVKIGKYNWDYLINWSTAYTSIASDISFPLTPVLMFCIGFLFAFVWIGFLQTRDIYTLALFYHFMVFFLFLPANTQVTNTPESYFSLIFLMIVWLRKWRILKPNFMLRLGRL